VGGPAADAATKAVGGGGDAGLGTGLGTGLVRRSLGSAALCLVLVANTACTQALLEPVPPPTPPRADNKLTVEGRFCTTDPDDLAFPVKLLFVIDTSTSMDATDPEGTRVDALIEVIDAVSSQPGVEIGLITFGLGANPLTEHCDDYDARANCRPGFAPPVRALSVVAGAGQAAGTTDFVLTLQSVVAFLADDMSNSDGRALQNARYAVLFLSDGLPDADGSFDPRGTCAAAVEWERAGRALPDRGVVSEVGQLLEQIDELAAQYDVRELALHTAFAAAPQTQTEIKQCGSSFLRAMARQGGGQFRDFSSGEAINFLFVDVTSFKRVFAMKSFLALNLSAAPFSQAFDVDARVASDDPTLATGIIDSDGDGLTDEREDRLGTDRRRQDTDGDGFSDLLEERLALSGSDPLDPTDADCAADVDRQDSDGDGLRDCEERFFGTSVFAYDTDRDGFGDGVEVHAGLNPGQDDTLLDVDFDGVRNDNELRAHSRIDRDDVVELSEHAYRYKVVEEGLQGARLCSSFVVDNIALASTVGALAPLPSPSGLEPAAGLAGGAQDAGENRILIEVTEQPFDAPEEPGAAQLACVRARFDAGRGVKVPANGRVTLPPEAFQPADVFDPAVHCVEP
jgi:hypothetical protein